MKKAISRFSLYIFDDMVVDFDEIASFQYGMELIASSIYCLGIALTLSIIFGEVFFGFSFILLLTIIKSCFTSYHATTRLNCCLIYNAIVLVCMCVFLQNLALPVWLPIVAIVIIGMLRLKEMNVIKSVILLAYGVVALVLASANVDLLNIMSLALITEVVLIIVYDLIPTRQTV